MKSGPIFKHPHTQKGMCPLHVSLLREGSVVRLYSKSIFWRDGQACVSACLCTVLAHVYEQNYVRENLHVPCISFFVCVCVFNAAYVGQLRRKWDSVAHLGCCCTPMLLVSSFFFLGSPLCCCFSSCWSCVFFSGVVTDSIVKSCCPCKIKKRDLYQVRLTLVHCFIPFLCFYFFPAPSMLRYEDRIFSRVPVPRRLKISPAYVLRSRVLEVIPPVTSAEEVASFVPYLYILCFIWERGTLD